MLAVITGVNGQDGSYLAEFLLSIGYTVVGVVRRTSSINYWRIQHLLDDKNFVLVEGDVTDYVSMDSILNEYFPDEVYNLAAQSHVGTSFKQPKYTWEATAVGCMNILEVLKKQYALGREAKFYQASSSEMFGSAYNRRGIDVYQDEQTIMRPQSPYAIAKLAAHNSVHLYRNAYDMFAVSGILFNHESERRGELFVTRKITKWLGNFVNWHSHIETTGDAVPTFPKLHLGNLKSCRDWGHAEDYVRGMYLMMQHRTPSDFVLSTGETYTIEEFLKEAFNAAGFEEDHHNFIISDDPEFTRPAEVDYLKGDSSRARSVLGWSHSIGFKELVKRMVQADIKRCQED